MGWIGSDRLIRPFLVMKIRIMPGDLFGRLTVIERCKEKGANNNAKFLCKCECGNESIAYGNNLKRGHTKSCGCLGDENRSAGVVKHGMSNTGEYHSWAGMIQRCTNPNHIQYKDWGGRGIKVCERWINSFENFYEDMGPKPTPGHSIDRWPNNDGDYELVNCRWGTDEQQGGNKRNNRWIEHGG
jgi:hypothetical protein